MNELSPLTGQAIGSLSNSTTVRCDPPATTSQRTPFRKKNTSLPLWEKLSW